MTFLKTTDSRYDILRSKPYPSANVVELEFFLENNARHTSLYYSGWSSLPGSFSRPLTFLKPPTPGTTFCVGNRILRKILLNRSFFPREQCLSRKLRQRYTSRPYPDLRRCWWARLRWARVGWRCAKPAFQLRTMYSLLAFLVLAHLLVCKKHQFKVS